VSRYDRVWPKGCSRPDTLPCVETDEDRAEPADIIAAIRDELFRLRARSQDVGYVDAIYVHDHGHGNAALTGSPRRPDFDHFGAATEILERLRGLPDDGAPEVIRSEFGRGH
jgi:hypothetical protein